MMMEYIPNSDMLCIPDDDASNTDRDDEVRTEQVCTVINESSDLSYSDDSSASSVSKGKSDDESNNGSISAELEGSRPEAPCATQTMAQETGVRMRSQRIGETSDAVSASQPKLGREQHGPNRPASATPRRSKRLETRKKT